MPFMSGVSFAFLTFFSWSVLVFFFLYFLPGSVKSFVVHLCLEILEFLDFRVVARRMSVYIDPENRVVCFLSSQRYRRERLF